MLTSGAGEIIMVMVGVLLALWVQHRNDDRKDAIKEQKLLCAMHINLERDLEDCRYNIDMTGRLLRGNQAVLKQLTERTPFHDPLRKHYGNVFGNTTLVPNTAAYDNQRSIGFTLVRHDSLRALITTLYSERYPYLHDVEMETDPKIQLDQARPMLHAKLVVDTLWASPSPIDPQALMDNAPFKGLLRTTIFLRGWMLGQSGRIEKRILALQALIEEDLGEEE